MSVIVRSRLFSLTFPPTCFAAILAIRGGLLAKPNYQFEKRQRDLAKKSKQEEKRRQKLAGKPDEATGDDAALNRSGEPALLPSGSEISNG